MRHRLVLDLDGDERAITGSLKQWLRNLLRVGVRCKYARLDPKPEAAPKAEE